MRFRAIILASLFAASAVRAEGFDREVAVSAFAGHTWRSQPPYESMSYGAELSMRLTPSWGVTALYAAWQPWDNGVVDNPLAGSPGQPATLQSSAWESVGMAGPTYSAPLLGGLLLPQISVLAGVGMVENNTHDVGGQCQNADCTPRGNFGFAIGGRVGLDIRPLRWLSIGPELQAYKIFYVSTTAVLLGGNLKLWF